MSIAIEAFLLREGHTGVERYILNLVSTICDQAPQPVEIFLWGDCQIRFSPRTDLVRIRRLPIKGRLLRAIFQHFIFPLYLRRFQCTFFTGYLGSLLLGQRRTAIAVFDLISLNQPKLVKSLTRIYYGMLLPVFLKRKNLIIVPSRHVDDEIHRRFPEAKTTLIPIPVGDEFYNATGRPNLQVHGGPGFVLTVGFNEAKKNHHLLSLVAALKPDLNFIIAGSGTDGLLLPGNVKGLGYVDQERLVGLFRSARALLCLSEHEGYCLPIYEAIISGAPVVCLERAPFTEAPKESVFYTGDLTPRSISETLDMAIRRSQSVSPRTDFGLIRWSGFLTLLIRHLDSHSRPE